MVHMSLENRLSTHFELGRAMGRELDREHWRVAKPNVGHSLQSSVLVHSKRPFGCGPLGVLQREKSLASRPIRSMAGTKRLCSAFLTASKMGDTNHLGKLVKPILQIE